MSLKKHKLTAALSLALAGASIAFAPQASAINLADDGLGEVALFQYFTVNNNWQTFFRIINTSPDTVAVKVRFSEAENSRDILDFVVVLSPHDLWIGWADDNVDGLGNPGLITSDNSCLAPDVGGGPDGWQLNPTTGNKFVTFKDRGITGGGPAGPRLREGHFEVISLGRIPDVSPFAESRFARDADHGLDGVPDCTSIPDLTPAFFGGSPSRLALAALAFLEPNNTLKANAYLFNLPMGQGAGYDPVMLANFWNPVAFDDDVPALLGEVIQQSQDIDELEDFAAEGFKNPLIQALSDPGQPTLNSTFPRISHVRIDTPFSILGIIDNIVLGNAVIDPIPGPTTVVDEWDRGVDAASAVLTRKSLLNEWAARSTPGAPIATYQTEWVVDFPTKAFYADSFVDPAVPIAPFSGACEPVRLTIWDREERRNLFVSPDPGGPDDSLCFETNVVEFGTDNPALPSRLGSNFALQLPELDLPVPLVPGQSFGWMEMEFIGDAAEAGLGSDPDGNQVYDTIPLVYNFGEVDGTGDALVNTPVDPAGLCATNPFPPGRGPSSPLTLIESGDGVGFAVPDPQADPAGSGRLPNTLLLAGIFQRPFLANSFNAELIDGFRGVCDEDAFVDPAFPPSCNTDPDADPTTPSPCVNDGGDTTLDGVNNARNASYRLEITTQYTGLPVTGFAFHLFQAPNSANSHAAIVEHGYRREVRINAGIDDVGNALCEAEYEGDLLFNGVWQCDDDDE